MEEAWIQAYRSIVFIVAQLLFGTEATSEVHQRLVAKSLTALDLEEILQDLQGPDQRHDSGRWETKLILKRLESIPAESPVWEVLNCLAEHFGPDTNARKEQISK